MSRSQHPRINPSQPAQLAPSAADDLPYWLALQYAPGVGPVLFQHILSADINPQDLFQSPVGEVLGDAVKLPAKTLAYFKNPGWEKVENDMAWAPLALSDGKLLVRDWNTLKCVDLK